MATEFPILSTERCILRQIQQEDVQVIFEGLSHPDVIQYYGVSYNTLEQTQEQMDWYQKLWDEQSGIWWGIAFRDHPEAIVGACGFNNWSHKHHHAEIGYWLLPAFQRQGIMTEAITTMLQYAFSTLKLHRISAVVEPENLGSIWLLEKFNFVQEGLQKDAEYKNGKYIDHALYAILNIK